MWSWVSPDDEPIVAMATTPDDEVVVALWQQLEDGQSVLRKHAPDGSIAWSRDIAVRVLDVAVGSTGSLVALGTTADGAWSLHGHEPDGTPRWEVPLPDGTVGVGLEALPDGTILVAANAGESAELRGYSAAGAPAFVQPLGNDALESFPRVADLATSPAGHVAAVGYLDEGSWAARLSPTGEVVWLHLSSVDLHTIAIDDDGAAFMTGQLDTDETQELELLLRRLDVAGALAWERTELGREGQAAAIGKDGTLYWAGTDYMDALVVALEPDGTERWIERSSGPRTDPDEDHADVLALSPTGELIAAGTLDYRVGGGAPDQWFRGWLGRYATDD